MEDKLLETTKSTVVLQPPSINRIISFRRAFYPSEAYNRYPGSYAAYPTLKEEIGY